MKVANAKAPALRLTTAVLAHEAVQPAFNPTAQLEVFSINRENQALIQDGRVEPVGQDQFYPLRAPPFIGALDPLVPPGEAVQPSAGRLSDRGGARRRLQALEGCLQAG